MNDPMAELRKQMADDQAEEAVTQLGGQAGRLYRAYVDSGVPSKLAAEMVRDWHQMMWSAMFEQAKSRQS